jgi:glycosyltransferase involved in cell wall biosynthesis
MRGTRPKRASRRIVLAVTTTQSLVLMKGFPEFLASRGWDVHVVTSGKTPASGDGVAFHTVNMARDPSPLADLAALVSWIVLLLRLRPTIVVAGTPKAGLLGTVAARVTGVPSRIYMLRGLRLETEMGIRRRVLEMFERLSALSATKVLAVSHSLREEFVRCGLCPGWKVIVLGAGSSNGVAVPSPHDEAEINEQAGRLRVELDIKQDRPVVGFVGRLSRDKGLPVLLTALERLTGESETQVLLVGPEEPLGFLTAAVRTGELQLDQVIWAGQVADVRPYYALMDVLCLPTKREGFPNVVLEASIQGIPTVASKVTGVVDAIVEGETGLLFTDDDPDELAKALRLLIEDPSLAEALGARAKNRAATLFSRSAVWTQTASFFEDELAFKAIAKAGQ